MGPSGSLHGFALQLEVKGGKVVRDGRDGLGVGRHGRQTGPARLWWKMGRQFRHTDVDSNGADGPTELTLARGELFSRSSASSSKSVSDISVASDTGRGAIDRVEKEDGSRSTFRRRRSGASKVEACRWPSVNRPRPFIASPLAAPTHHRSTAIFADSATTETGADGRIFRAALGFGRDDRRQSGEVSI